MITVLFKSLKEGAIVPKRMHNHDSGLDLYAYTETPMVIIPPEGTMIVGTGVAAELEIALGFPTLTTQLHYEMQIRPRSGMASKGIWAHWGTVDSGYRGELKVILSNQSGEPFAVSHGDRIAQLVVAPVVLAKTREVKELSSTSRGSGGFGSTGR